MQASAHWEPLAGASVTSALLLFIMMGVCATFHNSPKLLWCPRSECLYLSDRRIHFGGFVLVF